MKRRLPIGIQDFVSIRKEGFCYVDKTAIIHKLITGSGRAFFLSRPRRFGKSLLCSTLETVFEGRRELFQEIAGFPELAINSLEWEWEKHPVIRIDLNVGNYNEGADFLDSILNNALYNVARRYNMRAEPILYQSGYLTIKDHDHESENYYETVVHLIFTMLGFNCRSEVRIAAGRIDTLVETKNFVYCFEFKLNKTGSEEALAQIETKEYLLPWEGSGKKLFKIGINFDHNKRNIGSWKSIPSGTE